MLCVRHTVGRGFIGKKKSLDDPLRFLPSLHLRFDKAYVNYGGKESSKGVQRLKFHEYLPQHIELSHKKMSNMKRCHFSFKSICARACLCVCVHACVCELMRGGDCSLTFGECFESDINSSC